MDESRNKAQTYYRQGEWLYSIKYAEQWLSFAKEDQTEEAAAYDILANSYNKIAKWKESIENGNHELRIAIEVGDKELEAQARTILSSSYNRVNNYEQSIEHCNQILRIPEGNKQRKWDVQAYYNLALSSYYLQKDVKNPDYNESIKYGELQLQVAKELGDREGEMAAYLNLINSYTKSGDKKKADEYLQLRQRALQDQSQSKAAASGGFPNYSSESPQDGEHEKELAERGLTERLISGDFKEIEEEETDEARGKLPNGSSSESPQDGEHEKELADKGLTELSNSGDFKEIEEGETDEVRGKLPNGSCSVPSEVEARGPGAKFASENDLKTGKVKLHRARIILIGQDQAGKTSLKKSLFGLPFESEEESTEGVKVDPTVFEVEVKQVKNWPLSDDARIAAEEVKEEEPEGMKMDEGPIREEKKESATADLKIDRALSPKEVTDVLVQYLSSVNLHSDVTSVENHTTLDVWDFVGQHLYYTIYPVFLSPRAVYMLICNLSKDLKATATPFVKKKVFGNKVQNENSETNLENLLSWLTSVSTLCPTKTDATKKLGYLCPPIFIVGTHADKPHKDIKEMEKQIQKEIFDNKCGDHVVFPFFSVDNTQGSSGEGLAELRKRMNEVLMEQPYMGEEVPLRWLGFEKVVQAMVTVKVYYLKLEQLQTIIQKVCSIEDENEVATMLDFYHDLGVIVKHRNTVVLQAQWLIGIFKQLIALPSFKEMKPKHGKLWRDLGVKGVLSRTLVDHVFRKLCPIKEDILDMMEQFGLIAKFATSSIDENYFVPCQLKTPPAHIFTMKPTPSDPFPLYLHFELGFVPHGFFSQLVSTFTRSGFKSGFKEGFTMSPYFYDKVSKFVIEKKFRHHLVMLCTKGIIKIVLNRESPECSESSAEIEEVANTVRQSLENAIQSLTSKIPWLKDLKTDWCAACPNKYRNSDCLSLRKILEGGKLKYCEECHIVETVILPQLEKWFSMKDEQLLHDNSDGNDDGGDDYGNHGNMGDAVNDEVSEEQDLIQQFHELQLMGQEGDPVEQDPDKTNIHEGTVTSEGAHWDLKQGAVQLAFSPGAVSEPISIVVHKWKCSACSPQLQEHEAIVSNVIEISTKNGQPLEFNAQVMLMLYHSAPDLQGYELVIKMQINKEISEWVDVDGTEDLRRLRGIDNYASSQDMPDLNCFIARANITECSTYTVVSRLKSSPPYTITPNGGSFGHPYYPGVTVDIPEKAVAPNTTFPVVFKAQEIPAIEEYKDQDVFVGPFLRIICSQGVEFLKPVTIHLPVHVRGGPKGILDPLTYHVRVLFLRSDGEYKEWIDITSDLEHPPSFDGSFVKFQVKRFSGYTSILSQDRKIVSEPAALDRLSTLISGQPTVAAFFAYFRPSHQPWFPFILCLICCTGHLRGVVADELERKGITPSEDHSTITMIPGQDKAFVFVSRGESDVTYLKDFHLRFESYGPFRKELPVRLCSDQVPLRVEFYSTPSKEKLLSTLYVETPSVHRRAPKKPTPSQRPGLKVGKKRGQKGPKTVNVDAEVKGKMKTNEGKKELEVKDGIPSNDDLEWISKKIPSWKPLGRRLKFDDAALTGFHKGNDEPSEKAYAMLMTWKAREGSAATYQVLYDALCHGLVSRLDLAQEFCCY